MSLTEPQALRRAKMTAMATPPPPPPPRGHCCPHCHRPYAVAGHNDPLPPAIQPVNIIIKATVKHFGFSRAQLMNRRRYSALVHARHIGIYLCRLHTSLSYPTIGRLWDDRDHTSIMYAIERCEEPAFANNPKFKADMAGVLEIAIGMGLVVE